MGKFYGVQIPGTDGLVFDNWSECSNFVTGRKGIRYKSFASEEHADMFAVGHELMIPSGSSTKRIRSPQPEIDPTDLKTIHIWTDGATKNNGVKDKSKIRAGVGVYFGPPRDDWNISEPFMYTNPTNQRAEILAIIRAMQILDTRSVPYDTPVKLYTDSAYCIKAYKSWIPKWALKSCGWMTKSGTPVKNKTMFQHMYKLLKKRSVELIHVSGHSGIPGNEAADKLAVTGCVMVPNLQFPEYSFE